VLLLWQARARRDLLRSSALLHKKKIIETEFTAGGKYNVGHPIALKLAKVAFYSVFSLGGRGVSDPSVLTCGGPKLPHLLIGNYRLFLESIDP
jgi:hypothetical protein